MVSLKKRQSGFTIVELLIVIVVIGILATLVIVTFTGIQQKARNSQRQTDVTAVASHLAAYYADKGSYPTEAQLSTASWVTTNLKGLDAEALVAPKASETYTYVALPAGCAADACENFTFTATLEPSGTFEKKSSN